MTAIRLAAAALAALTVEDLPHMFEKVRGQELDDDALLLG